MQLPHPSNTGLQKTEEAQAVAPELSSSDVVYEEPPEGSLADVANKYNASDKKEVLERKQQKLTITHPVFSDVKEGKWREKEEIVNLPSDHNKEVGIALSGSPSVDLVESPNSAKWAGVISDAQYMGTFREAYVSTLEDQEADWGQEVAAKDKKLAGGSPAFKTVNHDSLQGERASMRVLSYMGLGSVFQVPLWHSGFWVGFKAPSDTEIVRLNQQLVADKIEYGRSSYGLVFSNNRAYTVERLIDFAINHIYDTSLDLKKLGERSLKSMIMSQDIDSFLWGLVCSMYPRGFQYRRSCTADPETCNHVEEGILNAARMNWVNRNALSQQQKDHMVMRQGNSMSVESVLHYQTQMLRSQTERLEIKGRYGDTLVMNFKFPNVQQYIEAGHTWIAGLVEMVDQILGAEVSQKAKEAKIIELAKASSMRQYRHFVESIEMGSMVFSDEKSITGILDGLSGDDVIRTSFFEAVLSYINRGTVSVFGIPQYDCPSCNKPQDQEGVLPNHKNILPLDLIQLFFELMSQKLARIENR